MDETGDSDWRANLAREAEDSGFFETTPSGKHHVAHVLRGETLIVTFETIAEIEKRADQRPFASALIERRDYSLLSVLAEGATWWRDPGLFDLFDGLSDDGFFDDFDTIAFVGSGMGGYGAAVFSVAAPGAVVLLAHPYATLDRARTPWELRHRGARRLDFTGRYAFGPDLVEAAERVFVIFDPEEPLDAMHATLFSAPHVTQLRARHGGPDVWAMLTRLGAVNRLIAGAVEGTLTPLRFAQLFRNRRTDGAFLRRLLGKVERRDNPWLVAALCRWVLSRMKAPAFARRLLEAEAEIAKRAKSG